MQQNTQTTFSSSHEFQDTSCFERKLFAQCFFLILVYCVFQQRIKNRIKELKELKELEFN